MDAVKYLKTKERICRHYKGDTILHCVGCPLLYKDDRSIGCGGYEEYYPEDAIMIVEKWGINNPIKTNWDKFKEVFSDVFDENSSILTTSIPASWWEDEYKRNE